MTELSDESAPGTIRAIARAFEVLRVMNTQPTSSLHSLHLQTRLPKSTLFRILHTLQQEGYVSLEGSVGVYRLTGKIREMSGGYTEKSLLVDVGSPAALRLTKQIKWPAAIGVLDGDEIVVRYSGMPYSPVAAHSTTLGRRLGLTDTAMGRVYLAFCPEVEREILFDVLRMAPGGSKLAHEALLLKELATIRRQGYAVRQPNTQRRTATLAAAIMHEDGVAGLIGMTTFGRLMTPATIAQYAPLLMEAASGISRVYVDRLAELQPGERGTAAF
jgi:IclR family mhp operon transcriptional activator